MSSRSRVRMKVELDRLARIPGNVRRRLTAVVRQNAEAIARTAQELASREWEEATGLPEVEPGGELSAQVVDSGSGAEVEFGTMSAPARPFLGPAVEAQWEDFLSGAAAAVRRGAGE
jgi:hypothetical protein